VKAQSGLWLLSAACSLIAVTASGQYSTGFEQPPFFSGEIAGQDLWTTTTATSAAARVLTQSEIALELTNAGIPDPGQTVHSGSQALLVSSSSLGSSATIRLISGLEVERIVVLDLWARPLSSSGSLGNIFVTMEDGAGDRAAAFRFGTAFGNTIDYGTNVTGVWQPSPAIWNSDTWYHLTLVVDYFFKTYDLFLDGGKLNVDPIPFYNAASDDFRQIRIFRGSGQAGMIVDDLFVAPEPGSAACLLAGAAMMLMRRSRGMR
jgi:hypothetical protein